MTPAGVTAKGERTRQRILETAADLFHRNGVNATTVGDVLRASGTGKGQFYQHFDGVDDLVERVLSRHRDYVAGPEIGSWDELEVYLYSHLDAQRSFDFERGCPIGTAAYSLQPEQSAARARLGEALAHLRGRVARFLGDEQQKGRLDAAADCERLAAFAIAATQGGLILSLVDRDDRAAKAAIAGALSHLHSHRTTTRRARHRTATT